MRKLTFIVFALIVLIAVVSFAEKPCPGVLVDWKSSLSYKLVGYWLFNEGNGDFVKDLSDRLNDGTLVNFSYPATLTSGWNPSREGVGVLFDGADDYVSLLDSDDWAFGAEDFTLAMWIKRETIDVKAGLFGQNNGANDPELTVRINADNTLRLHQYFSAAYQVEITTTSAMIDDLLWHHLIFMRKGDAAHIYIDGVDQDLTVTVGFSGALVDIEGFASIGWTRYAGANYFDGFIDEFAIWKRSLTQREIILLSNVPYVLARKDVLLEMLESTAAEYRRRIILGKKDFDVLLFRPF